MKVRPKNNDLASLAAGKCLYLSGLIPEPLTSEDDFRLLEHGIGFTNIVARTTRGSADLTRKEIKEGRCWGVGVGVNVME